MINNSTFDRNWEQYTNYDWFYYTRRWTVDYASLHISWSFVCKNWPQIWWCLGLTLGLIRPCISYLISIFKTCLFLKNAWSFIIRCSKLTTRHNGTICFLPNVTLVVTGPSCSRAPRINVLTPHTFDSHESRSNTTYFSQTFHRTFNWLITSILNQLHYLIDDLRLFHIAASLSSLLSHYDTSTASPPCTCSKKFASGLWRVTIFMSSRLKHACDKIMFAGCGPEKSFIPDKYVLHCTY